MEWVEVGQQAEGHSAGRAGRESGKTLLAMAFKQTKNLPSVYGVFGRKNRFFWQNGTRQSVQVMDHWNAPRRR